MNINLSEFIPPEYVKNRKVNKKAGVEPQDDDPNYGEMAAGSAMTAEEEDSTPHQPGETWRTRSGRYGAMNDLGIVQYFDDEPSAKNWTGMGGGVQTSTPGSVPNASQDVDPYSNFGMQSTWGMANEPTSQISPTWGMPQQSPTQAPHLAEPPENKWDYADYFMPPSKKKEQRILAKEAEGHKPGDVWKTRTGKFGAKNKNNQVQYFDTDKKAKWWIDQGERSHAGFGDRGDDPYSDVSVDPAQGAQSLKHLSDPTADDDGTFYGKADTARFNKQWGVGPHGERDYDKMARDADVADYGSKPYSAPPPSVDQPAKKIGRLGTGNGTTTTPSKYAATFVPTPRGYVNQYELDPKDPNDLAVIKKYKAITGTMGRPNVEGNYVFHGNWDHLFEPQSAPSGGLDKDKLDKYSKMIDRLKKISKQQQAKKPRSTDSPIDDRDIYDPTDDRFWPDEQKPDWGDDEQDFGDQYEEPMSKREAKIARIKEALRNIREKSPEGWEKTVKAMKKHKNIDNPWALAHWMKNKGAKSHKEGKKYVGSLYPDQSTATNTAKKKGLTHAGGGTWKDKSGKTAAKTKNGWLQPIKKQEQEVREASDASRQKGDVWKVAGSDSWAGKNRSSGKIRYFMYKNLAHKWATGGMDKQPIREWKEHGSVWVLKNGKFAAKNKRGRVKYFKEQEKAREFSMSGSTPSNMSNLREDANGFVKAQKVVPTYVKQINKPFKVMTREGPIEGKAGDYLATSGDGADKWAIDKEVFARDFKVVEGILYERNYKREYELYHSKPEQKKRRAQRNKTRRKFERDGRVKKGDGMDVHHRDGNPSNTDSKNAVVMSKSKNRAMKERDSTMSDTNTDKDKDKDKPLTPFSTKQQARDRLKKISGIKPGWAHHDSSYGKPKSEAAFRLGKVIREMIKNALDEMNRVPQIEDTTIKPQDKDKYSRDTFKKGSEAGKRLATKDPNWKSASALMSEPKKKVNEEGVKSPGSVWRTKGGNWAGKASNGHTRSFVDKKDAESYARNSSAPAPKKQK